MDACAKAKAEAEAEAEGEEVEGCDMSSEMEGEGPADAEDELLLRAAGGGGQAAGAAAQGCVGVFPDVSAALSAGWLAFVVRMIRRGVDWLRADAASGSDADCSNEGAARAEAHAEAEAPPGLPVVPLAMHVPGPEWSLAWCALLAAAPREQEALALLDTAAELIELTAAGLAVGSATATLSAPVPLPGGGGGGESETAPGRGSGRGRAGGEGGGGKIASCTPLASPPRQPQRALRAQSVARFGLQAGCNLLSALSPEVDAWVSQSRAETRRPGAVHVSGGGSSLCSSEEAGGPQDGAGGPAAAKDAAAVANTAAAAAPSRELQHQEQQRQQLERLRAYTAIRVLPALSRCVRATAGHLRPSSEASIPLPDAHRKADHDHLEGAYTRVALVLAMGRVLECVPHMVQHAVPVIGGGARTRAEEGQATATPWPEAARATAGDGVACTGDGVACPPAAPSLLQQVDPMQLLSLLLRQAHDHWGGDGVAGARRRRGGGGGDGGWRAQREYAMVSDVLKDALALACQALACLWIRAPDELRRAWGAACCEGAGGGVGGCGGRDSTPAAAPEPRLSAAAAAAAAAATSSQPPPAPAAGPEWRTLAWLLGPGGRLPRPRLLAALRRALLEEGWVLAAEGGGGREARAVLEEVGLPGWNGLAVTGS
ncbi:hypothetical protein GPECTOR_18g124 [Gonium pectorale]|uniref:Uncharacterized protein n=1 Tax=Gonium pectorale TaxID=33097 RepID=A0A150GJI2_GONPE|nr:hypothetical protein GPECTOR_18g124 [Gonium pectorale]|eukprot:KXZ49967.1 hypothetical protein GPECTOR_18g124 [Gonium pectorale]